MKDKIKNIAEKLEHQIRMHELDLNDRIKDIPQIILLLEQGFSELKEIVSLKSATIIQYTIKGRFMSR